MHVCAPRVSTHTRAHVHTHTNFLALELVGFYTKRKKEINGKEEEDGRTFCHIQPLFQLLCIKKSY